MPAAFGDYLSCTRASTGYAQTAAGVLVPFAANALRITDKGLLIEEARTNTGLYSQTFGSSWNAVALASALDNQIAAPDGTTTGSKLTEDTSAGRHFTYNVFVTPAGTCVASCYAKAGTRRYFAIEAHNTLAACAVFDLQTGAVTATAHSQFISAYTEQLANGWWRCVMVWTSSGYDYCGVCLSDSATPAYSAFAPTYTGDGVSYLYVWGYQCEAGSYATSYIPTTSAAVTRAADVVALIGPAATTIDGADVSAVASMDIVPKPETQFTILADPSVGYPLFSQSKTSVGHYGGAIVHKTGLASLLTTASKLGAAWNASGFSVTGQGLAPATSSAAPVNYGTIYLGGDGIASANCINTYIRRLSLWNSRISDAALQDATA